MVLVSGVLRFVQDEKSTVAAEPLAEMVESTAEVERDGDGGNETPIDEIVGDVIHLSSGDIVPADLRIFAARDLFVSQASLTGESEPIEKRASLDVTGLEGLDVAATAITDLSDLAFMGSTVISGNARGVVVATGARTMFGEATGTLVGRKRETSFDVGIKSTSRLLMRLMLIMLPVVFVISGVTKGDWVDALLFSLSVAVGLTPEMLPMLVTTCLGKGAVDLSRSRVIVKRLDSIQDLGVVDVLCTDKTGTLTEDRIVLERHLDVNGREDAIRSPRRWDTASVRRFMVAFGPLSSIFNILTFAVLFFFVCPAVAGGAWGALDATGQALFVGTFQAGWFVESMWTQTLVVHLIRTEKTPFVGSCASLPLVMLGSMGIAVATLLPASALGATLDFCSLPVVFWGVLAAMVLGYVAIVSCMKKVYLSRNDSLL